MRGEDDGSAPSIARRLPGALTTLLLALAVLLALRPAPAYPWGDGQAASLVLGQTNFTSGSFSTSQSGMAAPVAIAVDPTSGKVFVAEAGNHRVLRFASLASLSNGAGAEAVLGQADFTSGNANGGGSAAAATMNEPSGVAVGGDGTRWVADKSNHRALVFTSAPLITPTATATMPAGPTATTVPTPVVSPGDLARIVLNFVAGAPGSSFVVSGYNLPAGGLIQLTVNGVAVGSLVQADGDGRFTVVLNTASEAGVGFYVVAASSGGGPQARLAASSGGGPQARLAATGAAGLGLYGLTTSGPDAVVRQVPPESTAAQLSIPATISAFAHPPFVYLPLTRR